MKYILIAFGLAGCINSAKPIYSNEKLDTIKSRPATITVFPELFETAFIKGTTARMQDATLDLYGITIGKLKVTSGRIVACDPLHIDEYGKPYTQLFPIGEFPVQLSIAKYGPGETIAFARINFSDEPVKKWELALLPGQKPLPVEGEAIFGYGVDAGVGIFVDEEAAKALDQKTVTDMDGAVYQEMNKHRHSSWRYAIYNFGKYNLAAFTTGEGDGRYPTYIGFDAAGKPCRLVTDFRLFDWKKKQAS
jgi:hypothetical protein